MARSSKVYQWCFDFNGQPLLPGVQAPPMVEEKAWEVQAAFIRRVDEAVKELSGGGVDLERLAGTFRVVPASPEWVAVQRALVALEAAARFRRPPNSGDVDVVRAYTALLEQSGEVIALALVCGTLAGTGLPASTSAATRMTAGLQAIAALALGGTLSPLEVLRGVWTEAARPPLEGGLGVALSASPPPSLAPATLGAWKDWVKSRWFVAQARDSGPDLSALRAQGWDTWLQRFRTNAAAIVDWPSPTLPELVCRAAGVTPSALLPPALSTLSLEEWSALLVRSLAADAHTEAPAYVPAWMAVPALQVLGMGAQARRLIPLLSDGAVHETRVDGEIVRSLAARGTLPEHPPEKSFLVVRRHRPTRKWMPSTPPGAAVLALTLGELRALVEETPPPVAEALLSGFGHRVYDSDGYEAVQREADELIRRQVPQLLAMAKPGEAELLRKAEGQGTGQSPVDRLVTIVAPPSPHASLYARLAGRNGYRLPPGLAAFLAAPARSARGVVRVQASGSGFVRARKLGFLGLPLLGEELNCRYEGQTAGAPNPPERLSITFGRVLELRAEHFEEDGLLVHAGRDTLFFQVGSDLTQVRLRERRSFTARDSPPWRILVRMFVRPRFDLHIVETSDDAWTVTFTCSVLAIPFLYIEGEFVAQART
jgi:hypothetical protein